MQHGRETRGEADTLALSLDVHPDASLVRKTRVPPIHLLMQENASSHLAPLVPSLDVGPS